MPKQQKRPHSRRKVSIFQRVVTLFILVIVLDSGILLALLYSGGTFIRMHDNALNILAEVTRNKYQMVENKMVTWSKLDDLNGELDMAMSQTLKDEGKGFADVAGDAALNAKLVSACMDPLITHLRNVDVSGVFVVLNGVGVANDHETYAGVYLRDSEPSNHTMTNSDLHMLRGLPPLSRSTGITLDSYWQAAFRFEGGAENAGNDYFFKPLNAYLQSGGGAARYYGYWSTRFSMNESDNTPVFTYSRPLVDAGGGVYGVLGVEVEVSYMASVVNNGEYSERSNLNSFFLGFSSDGGASYQNVITSGVRFRQHFYENEGIMPVGAYRNGTDDFITFLGGRSGVELTGASCPLSLYSPNTAFSNDRWVLIGMQENELLFALESDFRTIVLVVLILGLALGVIVAVLAATSMSKPISALVRQLRGLESGMAGELEHTGLAEVDMLADTISELNRTLVEDASRISKIITLSGLPVGAFEKREDQQDFFCSDGLFKLLSCGELDNKTNRVAEQSFKRMMEERLGNGPEETDNTFLVKGVRERRYVRLKIMHDARGVIGTLLDVTEEIENRRRIEHERDYDLLTNILNRRAFETRMDEMFREGRDGLAPVSALVMLDMDNLKAINDAYGHDCGDLYIRAFAGGLHYLCGERCLAARRSGDEFYLFYYGYQSRDEIRAIIREGWEKLMAESFALPDGTPCRLRASAGIAWFPEDADEFPRLLHYADFAMYRVKNAAKGTVEEFNKQDYDEAGYLFNGTQALNRMLEEKLVRYMLQPIVSAADGCVLGYELLMRPQVAELPSPTTVLTLAKAQGKLYHVEYLTWDAAFGTALALRKKGELAPGLKLFINSIASQVLSASDERTLFQKYGRLYEDLVLEITENEQSCDDASGRKLANIRRYGGQIAIDDFGTGYNSDVSLIAIDATYVKLDMSFIRNADREPNKRALIAAVVQYARRRNIGVIAEGVETREEMEALCRLGVGYYQGYYIGRPAYQPEAPTAEVVQAIREASRKHRNRRGVR